MTTGHSWIDTLNARQDNVGLAGEFFTDPGLFAAELQAIHYHEWLFVGHTAELPAAGAFMTVQIGAYPLVLVRDTQDVIRAFHNACRHRGATVCEAVKGSAARLVCPYHQWTYHLDGRLQSARQMSGEFDRARLGLKPVACEVVAGYIFVSLAAVPPDFGPQHDWIAAYCGPHHLENAKVAFETSIIERGNWKLVWENNRECYHCVPNHPELCRTYLEAPVITGVEAPAADSELAAHWRRCEARGLPSTLRLSPDGQCRIARVPLAPGATSFTLSGAPAVKIPLSPVITEDFGDLLYFHYPSAWNHVLGDHALSFRVLPLSPTETQLTTKWLVHRDAVEGRDYDVAELSSVWLATNTQDQRIVESNQRGVTSPAYEPGPYSAEHEGGVRQFLDWYTGRMREWWARTNGQAVSRVA